jgi:DNA-binding transcriptional LysR family regulator
MDLYRLNLNLLIALDILLAERSVTQAAKRIFITQAAMSNNLQQLREIFKDPLLIRKSNGMLLTTYAKELQPKLHQVLQEVRSLILSGQRFSPETSQRTFRLGLSDYMSSLLLPKLIPHLQKVAPKIKISVVSSSGYRLMSPDPFENGEYDLGVGKIVINHESIKRKILFKDKVVCILNKKHPLVTREKINLKDYLKYEHIAIHADNPHFIPVIEQTLEQLGYQRNIKISSPFITPIFQLIEQTPELIGTVIQSMAVLYNKNHHYVIKPLPFKVPDIEFYLAWHHRYENDLGHQWLREQIIKMYDVN